MQSLSGVHVAGITTPTTQKGARRHIDTERPYVSAPLRGHQPMRLDIGNGPGDALFVAGTLEWVFA
jgi:hypothetical protein